MVSLNFVQQADNSAPMSRQQAKRRATEDNIIDAFGRLLTREGVTGLGVNALVKEAGIGKRQLYAYFGNLAGVALAWVKQRGVWPELDELRGEPLASFSARNPVQKIRITNRNYAEMLRRNPSMCELLAGEFTRSAEVKDAILHIRQLIRQDLEQLREADPELGHPDMLEINAIAYAASTYLALRANTQPQFFGFDLSTDEGWAVAMGMFDRVVDSVSLTPQPVDAA